MPGSMLGRGVKMVNKMEIIHGFMKHRIYWGIQQVRAMIGGIGCLGAM